MRGNLEKRELFVLANSTAIGALEQRLQARLRGQVNGFHFIVTQQGLILRGWAPSYYAKQCVQELVMKSTGMRILVNDIVVESPVNEAGDHAQRTFTTRLVAD